MIRKPVYVLLYLFILNSSVSDVYGQPYIDLVNIRYVTSPDWGTISHGKLPTRLDYFNFSTTLPLQLKNKRDAIIFSPYFETWNCTQQPVNRFNEFHEGLVLPVSFLKVFASSAWSLLPTAIIRMNDTRINLNGHYQFGGAILAIYRKNDRLAYKFGFYANGEFFGLFLIPLVGIDWTISNRTKLFGILPASLTLEHRFSPHFYAGALFRTFTNSYSDAGQTYFRVDENQLGIFLDSYLNRSIVLNLEFGHSLFRKLRTGTGHEQPLNLQADDNFYFKLGLAYRLRFRP